MKTKIFAMAIAALALAACDKNNDDFTVDNLKDTPITVSAGVADLATRAGYMTDATDNTKSVLPETFYLTVIQTDEVSPYNYYNIEMTKTVGENKYTSTDKMLWKDATRNPFVSAYTIEGTAFTVQTDQSTAENVIASDLLGAIKESGETSDDITINGDNISVRFRHLLCKLDVTYSWGTEFDNVTTKSIKNVVYNGFGTDAVLDRTTATITSGTYTDAITAFIGKTTVNEVEKDMSEAIFAPQTGNPKIVITALIDGVERAFSLNVTAPTGGFVSGNRYTMNVAIGGTVTQTGEMKISKGWENGDANGEEEGTTGNMETN